MSEIFLHPKRGTFYHRTNVPERLKRLLCGRRQIWRSLKTADKDEAQARSAQWDARVQRLFATLKREGERMNEAEREALVSHWLESELDYAEDCRVLEGPMNEETLEDRLDGLDTMHDITLEALLENDFRSIGREADELLKSAGLPALDHDGADFRRLCRRLLQARIEFTEIERKRWNGEHIPSRRPPVPTADGRIAANGSPAPVIKPLSPGAAPKVQVPTGPLFSEVIERYFAEIPRVARSASQVRSEFAKFLTVIGGDRQIDAITKADGRAYKDNILVTRKLSRATAIKHLSILSGFFKWCEKQGYVPENANPARGLAPDKRSARKESRDRKLFTDSELLTIFGSEDFIEKRNTRPAYYWVLLLCLFQICRREEAAQLAVADIQEAEGVPFMQINDNEALEQGLKNEGSKRRVPIHESLLRLGFLDYVKTIKAAGHTRLFPQLKKGSNGFGDAVGKYFSRLVTTVGLHDPNLVLHSLRHGGVTKLHESGCPADVAKILTGHTDQDVHGRVYLHRDRIKLTVLREGLNRLRYDQVVDALTSRR